MSRQKLRNRFNGATFGENKYNEPHDRPRSTLRIYPDNAVELIHKEVDTMVADMPHYIEERLAEYGSPEFQYALRLKKIGMTSSEQFVPFREKVSGYQENSIKLKMLKELQFMYPFRKFVLLKNLEELMEKWDLKMAPIDRYLGEIPEKNLSEIEAYPWVEDRFKPQQWIIRGFSMDIGPNRWPTFQVIAFPNQLNTKGLLQTAKRRFDYPKDPIVVCELLNDICEIVTKWGPEANDPMLTNPILN